MIGFDHEKTESRAAALQALLVTGGGGLAMLAGLLLLGQIGGTTELSLLQAQAAAIRTSGLYLPMLLLIFAGAFTKSAQFPFHFWLPGAMAAPTPVSAYLHSATMVKAGVYLLARLSPTLGGTEAWGILLTAVGAITMVVGGAIALYQTDLKLILAYSTVSALGTLVLLLGVGTTHAVTAAVVFLLAHAMYKGALFMIAGAVDHETGTRDVTQLGGLWRAMPVTAAVAALAAVSLAGFGPVLSFIGKELLLESLLAAPTASVALVPAAVLAGALFVAVAGIVGIRPFYGTVRTTPKKPHEAPVSMWLGPAVLAALGPAMGVAPSLVEHALVSPSVLAVLGEPAGLHLALWHGFNAPLALSSVSVIVGAVLCLAWTRLWSATPWMKVVLYWGPARFYRLSLAGLDAFARRLTRMLQNGYLRVYLLITLGTAIGLAGYTLISKVGLRAPSNWPNVPFYQAGLGGLMLLAALTAARSRSRLAAVASLSVVGYGVALIYILFGAPDLAMTQFMVETLTMMLFVLVFYHLPSLRMLSSRGTRLRDTVVALGVGGFMTALVLVVTSGRTESRLAAFFAEHSVPQGHGRNIVNVILVDFRAIDTLGEITVLSTAALGVFALLKLRPHTASTGPDVHAIGVGGERENGPVALTADQRGQSETGGDGP